MLMGVAICVAGWCCHIYKFIVYLTFQTGKHYRKHSEKHYRHCGRNMYRTRARRCETLPLGSHDGSDTYIQLFAFY